METNTVKGFRDIEDATKRILIRNLIEETFQLYNFTPVQTPIVEYEEFVKGENQNDEAVSDIFRLKDKGERKLALRYEFTFQLKRLINNKKLPYRRYQIGEVFRDEPISGNRWREFTQCDADIVNSSLKDQIEVFKMMKKIFDELKIKFTININNRKLLNEILDDLNINPKNRQEVIKEIDKLDKLSEKEIKENLKKFNGEKILDILKKEEEFFEKYEGYKEIKELKKLANESKMKLNFVPFLARGLSYYTGTIFEIKGELKETITGGGAYNVNNLPSFGISFGLDRIELLAKLNISDKKVLVISLDQDKKASEIAGKIREMKIPCSIYYGKPTKALEYANSYNIPFAIFIGEEEVKNKKLKIKNLKNREEKIITEKDLEKYLINQP